MRRGGRERRDSPSASTTCSCCWPTGSDAAAIGGKLYLAESTAKSHIARIYQKLGAANRAQALVTAMRIGLLSSVDSSASYTELATSVVAAATAGGRDMSGQLGNRGRTRVRTVPPA